MRPARVLAVAGALLLMSSVSPAQDAAPLAHGTRLRLTTATGDRPLVGRLVAADAATLTLQAPGQSEPVVVRRAGLTKVEMSAGRHSRGRGALLGAAIGAGAGAVIGAVAGAASGDDEGDEAYGAVAGASVTAVLLGSLGAVVGLAVPPSEKWQELPLDHVRLTLSPVRGRGLAVSLGFVF